MPDKAEKTEQPTSKRLGEVRDKGQVPQSAELSSIVLIVVLLAMVTFLAPELMNWFSIQMRQGLSCQTDIFSNSGAFMNFINIKIIEVITVLCPFFAALTVGAVVACVAIGGLNFSMGAIRFRLDTLNPAAGLKQLVNARSVVKLLMSILKLLFISIIAWFYLKDKLHVLAAIRWAWSTQILATIAKIILGLMIRVCIALFIIAIADAVYQKWKYLQDLKMTKQETKDERKQSEGPPEAKRRIRRAQLEMAMKRMLQEVPKANVVLVNPTHVAVALRYDTKTMEAPILTAKGADHLAEKIREIARAYGVPIIRRPELARTIYSSVGPGDQIPQRLYVAVAEILALIHRLRNRAM